MQLILGSGILGSEEDEGADLGGGFAGIYKISVENQCDLLILLGNATMLRCVVLI